VNGTDLIENEVKPGKNIVRLTIRKACTTLVCKQYRAFLHGLVRQVLNLEVLGMK
jgi:hypothetical protein